jgi:peroxiredoxin
MFRQFTRRRLAVLCAGGLLAVSVTACSGRDAVNQDANDQFRYVQANKTGSLIPVDKRRRAGAMTGSLIDGGSYALSSDAGKVVVVNYFASWCPPCQVETPQFDTIYRQRKGTDVTFVGVDAKDSPQSKAQSWLQAKGITFPVLYDPDAKTALELGKVPIVTLPATVLIDKQGRIAAVYQASLLPNDLTPVLNTLAGEV